VVVPLDTEKFQELVLEQLKALNQGQSELRQDVTGLKEDVTGLKEDVTGLKEDVTGLKGDVKALQEGQAELRQDVKELWDGQQRIELRIENELIKKIGALFDGFSLRGDQLEYLQRHIDRRLDCLATDITQMRRKAPAFRHGDISHAGRQPAIFL